MSNNIIITDFKRADSTLLKRFQGLVTSDIDDVAGRNLALSSSFKKFGQGRLCGNAFTINLEPGDNLVLAAALDIAQANDVLVIDGCNETERALVGDLLATYAQTRGIQGMIVNGAVRDVEELNAMDNFVVYAKSISPNGPYKVKPGSMNTEITIDNIKIKPGDIIIGDSDGIIVIDLAQAEEIIVKAEKMKEREQGLIANAKNGINPRPVTLEELENVGCIVKDNGEGHN